MASTRNPTPATADEPETRASRRHRHGATIGQVARHAGVSPMTVSRVINDAPAVRAETRAKVEAAIAALDYRPSAAARSLAGGNEIRIALVHANPSAAYLSAFLVGSVEQASRSGASLVVEPWHDGATAGAMVDRLCRNRIGGVVLPPPLCEHEALLVALDSADIAAVAVASADPAPGVTAVRIDDGAAAREMTRHLIALGHRRIGFITGDPDQTASARRLAGHVAAMRDAGLTVDEQAIAQGHFTYRSGLEAAERLLALDPRPTAIFASNDDMAAATLAMAHRRGLDVPGDVSICGFDDTAIATTVWPELTTIRQPIAAMAQAAVVMLVRELKARQAGRTAPVEQRVMAHMLIRRGSDGEPARDALDAHQGRRDQP